MFTHPVTFFKRVGGGGGSFSPDDLASLQIWEDANVDVLEGPGDPAEAGDTVTAWLDQSGNGNDPATTAGTFQTSPDRVVFSGASADELYWSANPAQGSASTVYLVLEASDPHFILASHGSSGLAGVSSANTLSPISGAGTPTFWKNGVQVSPATQRQHIYDAYYNAGAVGMVIVGVEGIDMSAWTSLRLYSSNVSSFWYAAGTIYEALVFDADVSANRADIVGYLATKWGITLP